MYLCVLAFLSGILSLQWFTALPDLYWFIPGMMISGLGWYFCTRAGRIVFQIIFMVILGCSWGVWRAQHILAWELPAALENKTVTVTGAIAALPEIANDQAQFEFKLHTLNGKLQTTRLRLSWYHFPNVSLQAGEQWQMQVRLKRPHGLLNPGGFDYEKWLFSRGIRATGYVLNNSNTHRLTAAGWRHPIARLREKLQQKIQQNLSGEATAGLITALVMGAQNGISPPQWAIMRATGTNHLMAIAGVHIGFVAGFIYMLVDFCWRRTKRLPLRLPAPQAAAIASLLTAIIYSALAGFSLPTQRALIMLTVFLCSVFLRRELSPWNSLLLALAVILVMDPFATLTVSFWLSFAAVCAILYGISYRLKPKGIWWKYGRVQWVITLGLIPVSLMLFQQASLIGLIANLIAVPAVGILVLPLCLSGTLLLFVVPPLGYVLLLAAAKIISVVWWFLGWLSSVHWAVWQQSIPSYWVLCASVVGIVLLLAPKGIPGRWLGVCWLLPLVYARPVTPQSGEVWFTLLDVGQGLSAVIRTQQHTLVFDTGPKMGSASDAGQRVILPFLQAVGITQIDRLIVSHGDSDHSGGVNSLLQQTQVKQVLTSVPARFTFADPKLCEAGQSWQWDGVLFTMLSPTRRLLSLNNNSSCVLKVGRGKNAILLTGDIEKMAENDLIQRAANLLPAQILVAPHHGSRTSSAPDFIAAIKAGYVLFPVGYQNRFHFPSQQVVERYQHSGAKLFNTAQAGAITFHLDAQGNVIDVEQYRKQHWHFWN